MTATTAPNLLVDGGSVAIIGGKAAGFYRPSWLAGIGYERILSTARITRIPDVRCLLDHDETQILGSIGRGNFRLWRADDGLYVALTVPDSTLGRGVLDRVKSTLIMPAQTIAASTDRYYLRGWSLGWHPQRNGDNDIIAGEIHEISIGNSPARQHTTVTLSWRSLAEWRAAVT